MHGSQRHAYAFKSVMSMSGFTGSGSCQLQGPLQKLSWRSVQEKFVADSKESPQKLRDQGSAPASSPHPARLNRSNLSTSHP